MFPMNGSNWSEAGQAVSLAGIPVPLFAAWLASKYILTLAQLGCLQQSPRWWRKWQRVLTDRSLTPCCLWPDANAQTVLVTPAQWHSHTNSKYDPTNRPKGHFESDSKTRQPSHNGINICSQKYSQSEDLFVALLPGIIKQERSISYKPNNSVWWTGS